MKHMIYFGALLSLFSVNVFADPAPQLDCRDRESAARARQAKEQSQNHLLLIRGVNMVGLTHCDPFYARRVLGLPVLAVAQMEVCGVSVGFRTRQAELDFARYLVVLGGTIPVFDHDGNRTGNVPVCGQTVGVIRPQ